MKILKQNLSIENALCLFIILCPILDIISFLFRNAFSIDFSPSTFIRPIIPISVALAIFIKCKFKRKNDYNWFYLFIIWDCALVCI